MTYRTKIEILSEQILEKHTDGHGCFWSGSAGKEPVRGLIIHSDEGS